MGFAKEVKSSILLYGSLIAAIERRDTMATVTRTYAAYILACQAGNKSKAAEILQVDRRTLHRWEREMDGLTNGDVQER